MVERRKSVRRGSRASGSRKVAPSAPRLQASSTHKIAVLYGQKAIRRRVRQLALQMNRDFAGTTLHLVGILERSFVFIADLVRQLEIPVVCHFLRVIVEDESLEGLPLRQISYGPKLALSGKDVVFMVSTIRKGVVNEHRRTNRTKKL
jgi:hypoxanthine phosphoribosyltransferase